MIVWDKMDMCDVISEIVVGITVIVGSHFRRRLFIKMDGKMARQLLFKKKLEEENREAAEKLRASLSSEKADKDFRVKMREKQSLMDERKKLVSELEKAKAFHEQLKQEEAVQNMLEIKVENTKAERANRLIEISKRLIVEEQNLKLEEKNLIETQYSMKLERKNT